MSKEQSCYFPFCNISSESCMSCQNLKICKVVDDLWLKFQECEEQITKTPDKSLCVPIALHSALHALASICKHYMKKQPS